MLLEIQCGEIKKGTEHKDGSYDIRIGKHKMTISHEGEVIQSNDWNNVKSLADNHPLFAWDYEDNTTKVLYLGWEG